MSEEKQREILENLDKQITPMPEEQKQFILGYMEGVCQMSERNRKEATKEEE